MSGETEDKPSGWTVDQWMYHTQVVRQLDDKVAYERDRRYQEVNTEREKALKIKETADLAALNLASEIQKYKDEKANNLREQLFQERGQAATKDDVTSSYDKMMVVVTPLIEYVAAQTGRRGGAVDQRSTIMMILGIIATAATVYAITR